MKRTMFHTLKGLAGIMLLLFAVSAFPQAAKRLILADGSFQTATEWKKDGDRVKYFSAERGEWEEIPTALIDWKATDEWNAERAKSEAQEMKQVTAEEITARKEAQLNTPLVAPELRLPAEGGVFLLETVASKPVLTKIERSSSQIDDNAGKNMLRKTIIPIASQNETIELKGPTAKVRVHSPSPVIFLDVENDRGVISGDQFRIVKMERKKNLRILARNKIAFTGVASLDEKFLHSRAEKFSGDWWKLIPFENLPPGEYAIVISANEKDDNDAVWDFAVEAR